MLKERMEGLKEAWMESKKDLENNFKFLEM